MTCKKLWKHPDSKISNVKSSRNISFLYLKLPMSLNLMFVKVGIVCKIKLEKVKITTTNNWFLKSNSEF